MTDEKNKPSLDEQTFGKLIEAAYVLQEHNREMWLLEESLELQSERLRQQEMESQEAQAGSSPPTGESPSRNSDYTLTLAEIVEAQHQIQIRHLEKDAAMAVVAERIVRITKASGAGIAILDEKTIRYQAGAGPTALPIGSETPLAKAICATCVRTGQVLRTMDVNTEFLFDPDLCRSRGIFSLVAVPVYHNGEIVGALELYFEMLNGFAEQDIHTCQLMAGLVTEAIGRDSESSLKQSMAAERSTMLAAIEKLKPSLIAIAEDSTGQPAEKVNSDSSPAPDASICWKCGERPIENEQFCGKCGAALLGDPDPTDSQSDVAATWHSLHTNLNDQVRDEASPNSASAWHESPSPAAPRVPVTAESAEHNFAGTAPSYGSRANDVNQFSLQAMAASPGGPSAPTVSPAIEARFELSPTNTFLRQPSSISAQQEIRQQDITWTSAAKARDFFEELTGRRSQGSLGRFWKARRGYIYLAVALIFVAIVFRWGLISAHSFAVVEHSAVSKASHKRAPDADLSLFDKFLISVGLAEAPPQAPEPKGNPETQVWVDLHTALYYCPNSELYGKTPKGRFESQRDAQLDQFEPVSRKACD